MFLARGYHRKLLKDHPGSAETTAATREFGPLFAALEPPGATAATAVAETADGASAETGGGDGQDGDGGPPAVSPGFVWPGPDDGFDYFAANGLRTAIFKADAGHPAEAAERAREVVKNYPNSPVAAEAERLAAAWEALAAVGD